MNKDKKHKDAQIGMGMSLFRFLKFWRQTQWQVAKDKESLLVDYLAYFLLFGWFFTLLGWLEYLLYQRRITRTPIVHQPVFLLGHWRSGTTYFHYLLSQDPQFACLTLRHASTYPCCLILDKLGWLKKLFDDQVPQKRPMDDVELTPDAAFEEEYALLYTQGSCYLAWLFPAAFQTFFQRFLFFGNTSLAASQWKQQYAKVIKKLNFLYRQKRLLLKNPINTARVKLLLQLYPDAKFIYIKRNPVDVFHSTLRLHRKMCQDSAIQTLTEEQNKAAVMNIYPSLLQRYFDERHLIPANNLFEVRYEDLVHDPVGNLASLYERLQLPGFEQVKSRFEHFVMAHQHYAVESYQSDDELLNTLRQQWHDGFCDWQPDAPSVSSSRAAG
ncbi:sulfotransferase family protein [Bowmanella denitrificans]|uniref:sulfotransferase family protein n=1 Tax=Bowmanella denitrificans TaxID=366582 RepID=UPI0015583608|nr:sulfotransferase [Bowmanella denitrificans]